MKKILILFLSSPLFIYAQINLKGKIFDAVTKKPIPFVNIENFKNNIGTQADKDGYFELNLASGTRNDTLKLSCVGYANRFIANLQTEDNLLYELEPVVFQLNEVIISNHSQPEIELGVLKKTGRSIKFFNQLTQRPGGQYAVFMRNDYAKRAFIKKIHFYIGNEMFNAPFRIRLYDTENNLPGKDILNKSIELSGYKKNSWNEFNFSEYHIEVPKKGFWVALEWIANDKFVKESISYNHKNPSKNESKKFNYYGPEIIKRFDTEYGLTYMKSLGNSWRKAFGKTSKGKDSKFREVNVDVMIKSTIEIVQ